MLPSHSCSLLAAPKHSETAQRYGNTPLLRCALDTSRQKRLLFINSLILLTANRGKIESWKLSENKMTRHTVTTRTSTRLARARLTAWFDAAGVGLGAPKDLGLEVVVIPAAFVFNHQHFQTGGSAPPAA
jgi:hypothetical protein